MEVSQEVKNRTAIQSSNSTSGYLPKENENRVSKIYVYSHVYCSLNHNNQDVEITYGPPNRNMETENVCNT